MSISTNYSVSYTDLTANNMSIKGQDQSAKKQSDDTSVKKSDMDKVSISTSATSSYKIGSTAVSKSEFDKYDANGDGQISQDELAAYEADKQSETEEAEDTDEASSVSASVLNQLKMSGTSTEEALLSGLTSIDTYA
ncbi:hypothetical protein [Seleniivibrio sp.]|uniref:hypothetical protein n=1 Tax=Seleniivibrio sp. TaxID=2898801 RepID=UPI0025D86813|nr:hypothetical protein [Seleniivibrio sp.]MCD8553420.1 hypothetical protein [Seleniivibrio sp.]